MSFLGFGGGSSPIPLAPIAPPTIDDAMVAQGNADRARSRKGALASILTGTAGVEPGMVAKNALLGK